ncbi:hypothetical protein K0M31_004420, partial [Melipona bicolor]
SLQYQDSEYPRKKPTIHLTVTTPFSPSNQHQKEMVFLHPEGRKSRNLQFHLSTLLPRVHPGASYLPIWLHTVLPPTLSPTGQFARAVCAPPSNKEGRQHETNLEGGESNRRKKRRRRVQKTPLDVRSFLVLGAWSLRVQRTAVVHGRLDTSLWWPL